MNQKDKLKPFISPEPSRWMQRAARRVSQADSQTKAQIIALNVLQILQDRKMNQVELADRMDVSRQQVSKILKGQENLTLDTIDKLEKALEVKLIGVELIIPKAENTITVKVVDSLITQQKSQLFGRQLLRTSGVCYPGLPDHPNTLVSANFGLLCSNLSAGKKEIRFISNEDISIMTGIQFMTSVKDPYFPDSMNTCRIPKEEGEELIRV